MVVGVGLVEGVGRRLGFGRGIGFGSRLVGWAFVIMIARIGLKRDDVLGGDVGEFVQRCWWGGGDVVLWGRRCVRCCLKIVERCPSG